MSKRNKRKREVPLQLSKIKKAWLSKERFYIILLLNIWNWELSYQTWLNISSSLVTYFWPQLEKDLPSKVYGREWLYLPPSAMLAQHPTIFTSVNFKARFLKLHSICKSVVLLHTNALSYWFHPWSQKDGILSLTKINQSKKQNKKKPTKKQLFTVHFFCILHNSNFHLMREGVSCQNSWLYLVLAWQKSSSCHLKIKTEIALFFNCWSQ